MTRWSLHNIHIFFMLKLYSQIWSVTISQQVHKCQKLHIKAERSEHFRACYCRLVLSKFCMKLLFQLILRFLWWWRGGVVWVEEAAWHTQSGPVEGGSPWWAGDHSTGHFWSVTGLGAWGSWSCSGWEGRAQKGCTHCQVAAQHTEPSSYWD